MFLLSALGSHPAAFNLKKPLMNTYLHETDWAHHQRMTATGLQLLHVWTKWIVWTPKTLWTLRHCVWAPHDWSLELLRCLSDTDYHWSPEGPLVETLSTELKCLSEETKWSITRPAETKRPECDNDKYQCQRSKKDLPVLPNNWESPHRET